MTITTVMCASFKKELMQGMHCLTATLTPTGTVASGNQTITAMSSIADICRGMPITGSGIAASSFVENIPSGTTITVSRVPTGSASNTPLTITGDVIKMALIKATPSGSYGASTINYSSVVSNTDETSGAGYVAGGVALTNVTPALSGNTAVGTFSPNPSWAAATFSTDGCIIYNSTLRGGVANRSISLHDFGGTQSVSAGTFTVIIPTADASSGLLRIA